MLARTIFAEADGIMRPIYTVWMTLALTGCLDLASLRSGLVHDAAVPRDQGAMPGDQGVPASDGGTNDAQVPDAARDLAVLPDLSVLPDLMVPSDLAIPLDFSVVHDLALPPDMATCAVGFPCAYGDGGSGRCIAASSGPSLCAPCGKPGLLCCKDNTGGELCNNATPPFSCCSTGVYSGMGMCVSEGELLSNGTVCQRALDGGVQGVACGNGTLHQPCCPGTGCTAGTGDGCCVGNYCVKNNDPCSPGYTCGNGVCAETGSPSTLTCGGVDNSCCKGSPITVPMSYASYCSAQTSVCYRDNNTGATSCQGSCGQSGDSKPACAGNWCKGGACNYDGWCIGNLGTCGPYNRCFWGACYMTASPPYPSAPGGCGGLGELPCVAGDSIFCTAPFTYLPADVAMPTCAHCGGSKEPCCPAASLAPSGYCAWPNACVFSLFDADYRCFTCGGSNQPCCQGSRCFGAGLTCNTSGNCT